ncbi:TPA: phage antirepressor KilAC domain-containing protein [Klebsiella pneumoniae]|uniref:phage antirepressor KilAC domain-containing protein n=1 Tax=Klebsiella pneumoniae TaxID=573 RepID=UPI0009BB200C|nr:DNA-binding protein [Klebsiella pneumoniae]HBR0003434.1 phage antirepressor KilAC domain-containing protein [Klebsiella aerogenes]HBS4242197.1 phage antirepressor KilAC domain-containing protein [Klebsiella quasipneumoniae subsp. quasipneumoniae]ELA2217312.1 phage antirepressor KilAC domain-containing protein [Klebsiella pneumoniae]ELA2539209.1 phage antirepressor KilAC domain-containing protein [Klebsiella pneumoniae]MCI7927762.1 phage antirepressor KilAC domain-containing protein [Klebsie
MNQLTPKNVVTMSSRDIADLVESRHDDVKRSIERLAERGIIQLPPMADVKNHLNQSVSVYLVGKRDSYVVVAQLSPEFTARLVDRWQELEAASNSVIPQSFSDALRLAADLEEEKQRLALELASAAPKVEFVDRYCTANGSLSFRQVAKLLKAKEPEFRLFLIEREIMYRLGGTLTPMAQHIDAGRFEVKTGTSQASNHAFSQARFTAKGVRWIGGLWTEYKAGGHAA